MSERADYLESEECQLRLVGKTAIFNALVACLAPEEACTALDTRFEQPRHLSRALVRQIRTRMLQAELPCHTRLLSDLEDGVTQARGSKRASAADALLRLAETLGDEREHDILSRLSGSPNRITRSQVYRRLKELPDSICPDYLVAAFRKFPDFEAARLLISRAPEEVLSANFEAIEQAVISVPSLRSHLYVRLEGKPPATLNRLKGDNPVSHAYVCARLGVVLSADYMIDLYKDNMLDHVAGLVAWCCGQMGHWDALMEIADLPEPTTDEWLAAIRGRFEGPST